MHKPPEGITPPAPGLDHEEPDLGVEDDIPSDDQGGSAAAGAERRDRHQDKPTHPPERE